MTAQVNHPAHYNSHPSGIECIEIIRPMHCDLANAVKYLGLSIALLIVI